MSSDGPRDPLIIEQLCPHCHAGLRAGEVRCWLCGTNVGASTMLAASRAKSVVLFTVLCCYLVSFVLPTIDGHGQVDFHQKGSDVVLGWGVFCQVILKLPFSAAYLPAWFANCIFWFGLLAFNDRRWRRARKSAWLCVVLALSTLLVASSDSGWLTILMGYYVWLLSMVMFLVGSEVIGMSAKRSSNRGFEEAHRNGPMSVDASHDHLSIEPAAGGFARQFALGLWGTQLFATALAVLAAMGDVTTIIGTGIPLAIIGLALTFVTRPIGCWSVSLFSLSAPLLYACCVLLGALYGRQPVPIQTILVLYALFALPTAAIARNHILHWSHSEEPTGWQFSLKSLLVVVTVLGVVCACVGTAVNLERSGRSEVILLGLYGVTILAIMAGAAYFVCRPKGPRRMTDAIISRPVCEDPALQNKSAE